MNRLTKTAKVLDVVLRVAFWILILAAVVAASGCVLSFFAHNPDAQPKEGVQPNAPGVNLGFVTLQLAANERPAQDIAQIQQSVSLLGMLGVIAGIALAAFSIHLLRGILKPMKQGQPFQSTIGTNLKKLGWLSLVGGGVLSALQLAMARLVVHGYDLKHLLVNDKISDVTCKFTFDAGFLLVAAVCFLLSYIFTYGAQLQQLSDETL